MDNHQKFDVKRQWSNSPLHKNSLLNSYSLQNKILYSINNKTKIIKL